jgi:magnesium-transporting ATPase (P-type)
LKEKREINFSAGKNLLTPPKVLSMWKLFLRQFYNMCWMLVMVSSLLSFITYFLNPDSQRHLFVAVILFAIVFVMCLISFNEEKKARNVCNFFIFTNQPRSTIFKHTSLRRLFHQTFELLRIEN